MTNGSIFEIVILAMVALYLVWKLGSVLGRRTGDEQQRQDAVTLSKKPNGTAKGTGDKDKVVPISGRKEPAISAGTITTKAEPGVELGIAQIRAADGSFDPTGFAKGAGAAFQMIVAAFAEGDTGSLRPLLSDDLYDEFSEAIRARLASGDSMENRIEALKSSEIVDARMEGRTAFVTVKFLSSQINVVRNAEGEVTDGDPDKAIEVTDLWTFARNTRATDPNWTLVETDTPTLHLRSRPGLLQARPRAAIVTVRRILPSFRETSSGSRNRPTN